MVVLPWLPLLLVCAAAAATAAAAAAGAACSVHEKLEPKHACCPNTSVPSPCVRRVFCFAAYIRAAACLCMCVNRVCTPEDRVEGGLLAGTVAPVPGDERVRRPGAVGLCAGGARHPRLGARGGERAALLPAPVVPLLGKITPARNTVLKLGLHSDVGAKVVHRRID